MNIGHAPGGGMNMEDQVQVLKNALLLFFTEGADVTHRIAGCREYQYCLGCGVTKWDITDDPDDDTPPCKEDCVIEQARQILKQET
jgi:hypothetical protein